MSTRKTFRAARRAALCVAVAATFASGSVLAAAVGPHAGDEHVLLPAGVYGGNAPGRTLVHDYGATQLWRVDAAHRSELRAAVPGRLRLQPHATAFEAGALDLARGVANVPAAFRPGKPSGVHLQVVQFVGPVTDEWLEAVRATGMHLVQPLSGNAYAVLGDRDAALQLDALVRQSNVLRAVAPLPPFFKLNTALAARARTGLSAGTERDLVVQVADHPANKATRSRVAALHQGAWPVAWDDRRGVLSARVRLAETDIVELANLGDVFAIEPFGVRERFDEVQTQILAGNLVAGNTAPAGPGYLAWLTGLGFPTTPASYPILDIVDDGLGNGSTTNGAGDPTLTLAGDGTTTRVASIGNCTGDALGDGQAGHGHINSSIAGGYDQRGGFPYVDGNGYLRGLGVNPFARLAHTKIFTNAGGFDFSACGNTDAGMIRSSQDRGAAITSNSWGCRGCAPDYNDSSRAYDIGTRDADLTEAGNQPLIHLFAAGNSGSGASTVGTPGTAKNVITVGASENVRPSDEDGSWTDGCGTGPTGADSAMDVIGFSSRGPVEGGRIKPEVIAPGTHVQGTASTQASYDGTGTCDQYRPGSQLVFAASSGTSHSTPAVSGVVSLLYWWLQDQYAIAAPSAAVVKAYLIAHPTYLTGTSANDTLPSNVQGYGMPDMGAAFNGTLLREVIDQQTVFAGTGETSNWTGSVADPAEPVRIVLAWSDAPGAVTDTTPQVNDLDLVVTIGGVTYLGNRFTGAFSSTGGSADTANNYEAVFLPAGTTGAIEINVTAMDIAGDGVPNNGDATDQDFALVCANCLQQPTFTFDATPETQQLCGPDAADFEISIGAVNGYTGSVALDVDALPAGAVATFDASPVSAPGTSGAGIATGMVASGDHPVRFFGSDGVVERSDVVTFQYDAALPQPPLLLAPGNGQDGVGLQPVLSWDAASGAREYIVEVDDQRDFSSPAFSQSVAATSVMVPSALPAGTTLYWRVTPANLCGTAAPSSAGAFTTGTPQCASHVSTDVPLAIGPGAGTVTSSTLSVPAITGASVVDVDVVGLRGLHTWNSDLEVHLLGPTGGEVLLYAAVCTDTDNFHLTLDDAAAVAVGASCPPGDPAGAAVLRRPTGSLAALNGIDPQGTWTLQVTDQFNQDGGQLQGWGLQVCATAAPAVDALHDTHAVVEDTLLPVASAGGVLANDLGTGLGATLVAPPANGTLVGGLSVDGSFAYQPEPDFCGTDSFSYGASDGVDSDSATVVLEVACVNDAPTAAADAFVAQPQAQLAIDAPGVLANDVDVEGDTISVVAWTQPGNGTVSGNADGSFTYAADGGFCGEDAFTYTATDGVDTSAPTPVTVDATCANTAPVANGTLPDRVGETGQAVAFATAGVFSDPDGDTLTFDASGLPASLSIDASTGVISGTLAPGDDIASPYAVVVTASDPALASVQSGFTLQVGAPGSELMQLFSDGFE